MYASSSPVYNKTSSLFLPKPSVTSLSSSSPSSSGNTGTDSQNLSSSSCSLFVSNIVFKVSLNAENVALTTLFAPDALSNKDDDDVVVVSRSLRASSSRSKRSVSSSSMSSSPFLSLPRLSKPLSIARTYVFYPKRAYPE